MRGTRRTREQIEKLVNEFNKLVASGMGKSEACEKLGVHKSSMVAWRHQFEGDTPKRHTKTHAMPITIDLTKKEISSTMAELLKHQVAHLSKIVEAMGI